jgi:hypothetical protein
MRKKKCLARAAVVKTRREMRVSVETAEDASDSAFPIRHDARGLRPAHEFGDAMGCGTSSGLIEMKSMEPELVPAVPMRAFCDTTSGG